MSYDNGLSWKPVAECDGYTPGRGFDENSRGIRQEYEKTLERLRITASATSAQNGVGVVENGRMDFQQAQVSTKISYFSLSLYALTKRCFIKDLKSHTILFCYFPNLNYQIRQWQPNKQKNSTY